MPLQLVMDFELAQGEIEVGWSEEYDFGGTSIIDFVTAQNSPGSFLRKRLAIFGAGVIHVESRIALQNDGSFVIGPQRRTVFSQPGLTPQFLIAAGGQNIGLPFYNQSFNNTPADFAQSTQLIRLYTSLTSFPQYTRNVWLSGCPDASQVTNQIGQTDQRVKDAITAWAGTFQAAGFGIRSVNRDPGVNPPFAATAVDGTGLIWSVTGAAPFVPGMLIVATGFRASSGGTAPRGNYTVLNYTGGLLTLNNQKPAKALTKFGIFRPVKYITNNYGSFGLGEITNRKRGRPFGLLRGRRSTQHVTRA